MQQIDINIFYFINVLKKYKLLILCITIIAFAIGAIVAFILPVQYESKATFYPYSPESSDPRVMMNAEANFGVFSDVDQSERFILMGRSQRIKNLLIKKYNLYKRYNIDTADSKKASFRISEEMVENIKLKKGENGAVVLSVLDVNRDTAALMANDMLEQIETISNENIREKNQKVFQVFSTQFLNMQRYVEELKDSLRSAQNKKIDSRDMIVLNTQLKSAIEEFTKLKVKFENARTISSNDLKSMMIIEPAQVPYKKAKPSRMLIIGASGIIAFFIALIALAIYDFIKAGIRTNPQYNKLQL